MKKVMDLTGEPLPYGIEPNRHVLEAIIGYSVEQGIIPRRFTVDEIFASGAHELAG
jgi:4,5-dihydroxyphthalate decarboxylase